MSIIDFVHRSDDPDGPFMTVSEVAEYLECHVETVRRRGKALGLPTHKMPLGTSENAFVWLYTEGDVTALETYSNGLRPGRKPKKDGG